MYFESKIFRENNNIFVIGIYALASVLLYYKSLNNFFISDDYFWLANISKNNFSSVFWYFPADSPHIFRPFSVFYFKLLYLAFGLKSNYYMYSGLILHIINSYLVFLAAGKLLSGAEDVSDKTKTAIAFFSGLLFSVHYIHAESVLFISCMSELLFTLFYLLSFVSYLNYRKTESSIYRYLMILFFVFSLLSKESGISFIALLFAIELLLYKSKLTVIFKNYWALFSAGLIYLLIRFFFFPRMLEPQFYAVNNVFLESVKNIVFTYTALFFSLDFMAIKHFFRTQPGSVISSAFKTLCYFPAALAALSSASILYFVMLKKRNSIALFAFFFIFITVAPTLWLAGFERYIYLPSAGFAVLLVYSIFKLIVEEKIKKIIGIALLSILFAYNIISLYEKNENWYIAAKESKNIVEKLMVLEKSLPADCTVYFKGLPDNYKGAWVFRNGIEQMPVLFLYRNDLVFIRVDSDYDIESDLSKKIILVYFKNGSFNF